LFTGKLPSIQMDENRRPRLSLVDVGGLYESPPVITPRAWDVDREAI